ncbi:MFS transporter [Erwinia endophytica]|uniref:MFS transporter n=1 Tax=Erwinia endophytica TaxID=1563158 RepID=UPI001265FF8A|nr:MFS transporter [Erwinia endophytica]KAB8307316.1 MFS transporter [Erwinia endophytica]
MTSSDPRSPSSPKWLLWLLAVATGLIAANIYYAQPLVGAISKDLGLSISAAGLIVTLTQVGYGSGLLLIVPLADYFENKRLAISVLLFSAVGLLISGLATSSVPFLIASLLIGLGSVTVQILVPYAAHLAPDAMRGRVVGNVMSGLMLGIMLARPVASLITEFSNWRMVFFVSFVAMLGLALLLHRVLPPRQVSVNTGYREMLVSMYQLMRTTAPLQRRSFYHACLFGAFSLFWTTVPLLLSGPDFRLSQTGIALFSLAGVAGAIAAPLAGRLADRGWIRGATGCAMFLVIASFMLMQHGEHGSLHSLALLTLAAIMLDFGVSANLVLGQRVIFSLSPTIRGRLNGLYMATFFAGGAIGSASGGWVYAHYGWRTTSALGAAFGTLALLFFFSEFKGKRRQQPDS